MSRHNLSKSSVTHWRRGQIVRKELLNLAWARKLPVVPHPRTASHCATSLSQVSLLYCAPPHVMWRSQV
jgi:hypothetical protein